MSRGAVSPQVLANLWLVPTLFIFALPAKIANSSPLPLSQSLQILLVAWDADHLSAFFHPMHRGREGRVPIQMLDIMDSVDELSSIEDFRGVRK